MQNLLTFLVTSLLVLIACFAASMFIGVALSLALYATCQLLVSVFYASLVRPLDKSLVDPTYYTLGLIAVVGYYYQGTLPDSTPSDGWPRLAMQNVWPFVAVLMLGMKLARHQYNLLSTNRNGFISLFEMIVFKGKIR